LIIASVTYVIGQMKGIGVAFGRFLEVDYTDGLLIATTRVARFFLTIPVRRQGRRFHKSRRTIK